MDKKEGIESEMREIMKYEWMRLASFGNYPSDIPVHSTRLAEAGFFYSGQSAEVTCFACGAKYKGWKQGDSPMEIHKTISPECNFINGNGCKNINFQTVPAWEFVESYSDNKQTRINSSMESTKAENGQTKNQTPTDVSVQHGACGGPLDVSYPKNIEVATEGNLGARMLTHEHISNRNSTKDSQSTLASIAGPRHSFVTTNNETHHHDRNSSSGNNSLKSKQSTTSQLLDHQGGVDNPTRKENVRFQLEPLGISFERPVYPQFAIATTRHSSFRKWPKDKKQRPEEMARAGYFHEGVSDRVRCFFCGGGLCNWDPEDHPWIEHARWYPRCIFLRQSKGDRFIYKVQEEVEKGNKNLSYLNGTLNQEELVSEKSTSKSKENDMFSHPAVLSVLDMGVSRQMIDRALEDLQRTRDLTAEKLLLKVWEIEETDAKESTRESAVGANAFTDDIVEKVNWEDKKENDVQIATFHENSESKAVKQAKDKAERLAIMEENRHLKELQLCKICLDEDVAIVFLPCGHMATCASCAPALRKCPICRTFIKGTVKAILS